MYVCVLVADEDVTVATLQPSVNVQGTLTIIGTHLLICLFEVDLTVHSEQID